MTDDAKKRVAEAALGELPDGGIIGLGTGSTAYWFVEGVAALVRQGRRFTGVCTSEATRAHAAKLGVPLLGDDGPWSIDVTVDGADEVSSGLDVSKGAGGALTREKIVCFASRRFVVICDATKCVGRIGETRPISLEVLRFGHLATVEKLAKHGRPILRRKGDQLALTDAGNLLVDLAVDPVEDPAALDRALRDVPGVVETGLFVGRADVVLVARGTDVERRTRR